MCETRGFRVEATPHYLAAQSRPDDSRFVFGYRVRIHNASTETARLVSRRWLIVDANGQSHTVEGPGVVGRQPMFAPGESFEYESFCPLPTAWGTMEGSYRMEPLNGEAFEVVIARFYLVAETANVAGEP